MAELYDEFVKLVEKSAIDSLDELEESLETALESTVGMAVTKGVDGSAVELILSGDLQELKLTLNPQWTSSSTKSVNMDLSALNVPGLSALSSINEGFIDIGSFSVDDVDLRSESPASESIKGVIDNQVLVAQIPLISGLGGADKLFGDAGDDVILGGADNDQIFGGAGAQCHLLWKRKGASPPVLHRNLQR